MPLTLKIDKIHRLPYFRKRTEKIKYLIIHCSRSNTEGQIQTLERYKLSAHYIIDRKGCLTEVIPPQDVAYHAGLSNWQQSSAQSLNETSIGIELECPDMGQSKRSYPNIQIQKLCLLLKYLKDKYHIKREHILGHSDIAPQRKPDPGLGFPWKKLIAQDLGVPYRKVIKHRQIDEKALLQTIGYDTSNLNAARYAFCRHWLPNEVTPVKDIQYLVDNPFPKDFKPKNQIEYEKTLYSIAKAYQKERQHP